MILLVGLVILFLILVLGIWLTANLIGLVITLFIAGLLGWLADLIVPGRLPYGWLGSIVAGLGGSWVGGILLGDYGPELGGIALIPALLGAVILAFAARFIGKSTTAGSNA
jgi:uncharacterized membrane protein YeaQ/YmgE (transglycosylase-associated protein family)